MRALGLALALAASASGAAAPPLARLADAVADEVFRVAAGQPVELTVPEDRTGSARALDLQALVLARLERRVSLATTGPRRRIVSVLSYTGGRMVLSGRVVAEPGGRLVDLLSASVEADPALLALGDAPLPPRTELVEVRQVARTPALGAPVLDLAFAGDDRLLVLSPDTLTVWRRDGLALRLESRRDLGPETSPARRPGGRIAGASDGACWIVTGLRPAAVLFALDDGRLRPVDEALAAPLAGLPQGLRFRPGTNLLETTIPGLGDGPFLAVVAGREGLWVAGRDGRLGRTRGGEGEWTDLHVGPALAPLWPGLLAAASADPPSASDRVVLLAHDAEVPRAAADLPVEGSVRALAARPLAGGAVLAIGVEEADGWHVVLLDLAKGRG